MALLSWLRGKLSHSYRANWILGRAILNARAGRTDAALESYSEVIKMEGASANTRAMALFNRGLLRNAAGNTEAAVADLEQILEMPGVREQVVTEARRKLMRMTRSTDRTSPSDGHRAQ
ncbi:tetratricopeptide repeat protein [Aeoliella sp. SH292]|uniref:tetratricopeptide repeat protein n=1 Tax=Aeoliella sp. SH292 TaxID=3454464 RepID=UPI003F96145A